MHMSYTPVSYTPVSHITPGSHIVSYILVYWLFSILAVFVLSFIGDRIFTPGIPQTAPGREACERREDCKK